MRRTAARRDARLSSRGRSACARGSRKVGIPGAPVGLQDRDITIAQALKPLGYSTGQFGKNHLGDRDEYLPTKHGFDEFFGNLYHLNAEEEPERPYCPKNDTTFVKAELAARRAQGLRRRQDRGYRPAQQEADGDGRRRNDRRPQSISCSGRSRANKPFFTWMNTTRMHVVHPCPRSRCGQERHARQRAMPTA